MPDGPRCFVISPIGSQGSAIRQHADDVFDYILRPATEECGIVANRSDHLLEPGRISEQMFREIVTSQCCLCVLTGHNPNVFYELAIAQTVGTPVIILIEKSEELPFDIRDLRCVRYDLAPRPLFEKVYAKEVVAHLRSLEAASWVAAPLLSEADLLSKRPAFPQALLDELSQPIEQRIEGLSSTQRQMLFTLASLCRAKSFVSQHDLAAVLGKSFKDAEMFYRLETLRLTGFIERHRDADANGTFFFSYGLTPGLASVLPRGG